ncbi:nickel ABC transporter permease subunit NikC [Paenibacillus sp. L3-i20]|nr:nickel ABC transporter permease subunit NikC [Paenibacillus sp. L3-i20]
MMMQLQTSSKKSKTIFVCTVILIICFIVVLLAPWVSPHDPVKVDLAMKLQPSSTEHWLGTDHLGRDILSRLIYGARVSVGLVIVIFIASVVIGMLIGVIAGYRGGWLDSFIMRICDGMLAFPNLVLVLGIVGIMGTGTWQVVLALLMVHWVYYARMSRGYVVSLRGSNFVAAARISGSSPFKIIMKHILPNMLPQIIVIGTLDIGFAIMDISALSFLGLGIQPPTAEWGAMILEGRAYIRSHPELMLYPGLMILLVVMTFNLLGEALSQRFGIKK